MNRNNQAKTGGLFGGRVFWAVVVSLLAMGMVGLWVQMRGDVVGIWASSTDNFSTEQRTNTDEPVPTNLWINLYSTQSALNAEPLPLGTQIRAYDPQGTLSGKFTVTMAGNYGLMPIYGDDPSTPQDEGAVPGDLITVTVDDFRTFTTPAEVRWTAPGDLLQVDLAAFSGLSTTEESGTWVADILGDLWRILTGWLSFI
jgi:hypothetical protein